MKPICAIIDPNALAVIGLRHLLQEVMPFMQVEVYQQLSLFQDADPTRFAHFFVAQSIVLSDMAFFQQHRQRTIVLSSHSDCHTWLAGFHVLSVYQSEEALLRQLLALVQHGHANGRHLPPLPQQRQSRVLSDREVEVLSLIVRGLINKEIAELLHISLTTVISHRKNIMEKLGIHSVSGLTIYAVMHGYVDINSI